MTDKQRIRKYFPAWHAACRAQGWNEQLFAAHLKPTYGAGEVARVYLEIIKHATQIAQSNWQPLDRDDLRMACTIVATGKAISSKLLDNRQLDRVLALFALLRDPNDLSAISAWLSGDKGERLRLVRSINDMLKLNGDDDSYVVAICCDRTDFHGLWEPPFWENLPIRCLRMLGHTMRARKGDRRPGALGQTRPTLNAL